MGVLSAKLRGVTDGHGAKAIAYFCPGCRDVHVTYYKEGRRSRVTWTYNHDHDRPTLSPSVRMDDEKGTKCHYVLEDGLMKFFNDSRHRLRGMSVELPDWPYAKGAFGGVEE